MRTAFLVGLLAAAGLKAQTDPLEKALRTGGDRPGDLAFELRVADARNVFRPGEPIVLEMLFRAEEAGKYRVQGSLSPWFEMDAVDRFEVDPEPAKDSLVSHFKLAAAGLNWTSSVTPLAGEEIAVPIESNGALRLISPGTYKVRAATRRVSVFDIEGSPRSNPTPLTLVLRSY